MRNVVDICVFQCMKESWARRTRHGSNVATAVHSSNIMTDVRSLIQEAVGNLEKNRSSGSRPQKSKRGGNKAKAIVEVEEYVAPDNDAAAKQGKSSKSKKNKKKATKTTSSVVVDDVDGIDKKQIRDAGTDQKLRGELQKERRRQRYQKSSVAKYTELLAPGQQGFLEADNDVEKTHRFTQKALKKELPVAFLDEKCFKLHLPQGAPYRFRYSRNGRWMAMGSRKTGHIASFDWQRKSMQCELFVGEAVRDVTYLQNETMFAAAQKKYTYIYDREGVEMHCLQKFQDINRLEYLPYHFLLAGIGNSGWLRYIDISTGEFVGEKRTRLGPCSVLAQNPWNAVLLTGHNNGVVQMWTPNMSDAVVKMHVHRGPVGAVCVDHTGHYLVTSGADRKVKVWDVRTYKLMHTYSVGAPPSSLDLSQRGVLAMNIGTKLEMWKDALGSKAESPYMIHRSRDPVDCVRFAPYEDVLGVSHASGFETVVVPGCGEANFDSYEANPFQTRKQRQEAEVHQILDKLPADSISLNPNQVGLMDRAPTEVLADERRRAFEANNPEKKFDSTRKRARGRNSALNRFLKKQDNVVDKKRERLRKKVEREMQRRQLEKEGKTKEAEFVDPDVSESLQRFVKKVKRG